MGGHLASAVGLCVMLLLRGVDGSLEGGSEREARASILRVYVCCHIWDVFCVFGWAFGRRGRQGQRQRYEILAISMNRTRACSFCGKLSAGL